MSLPEVTVCSLVAFVQARFASRRLPGKVLADIAGRPMLWHVVEAARRSALIDQVVVLTSDSPADDALADFCSAEGFPFFRGDEKDVLDRFYRASLELAPRAIVRLTGDCPFLDPKVIDKVVDRFLSEDYDYVSNTFKYTYPDGLDVEVFSTQTLHETWREARLPTEREHVTPFMRDATRFRVGNVEAESSVGTLQLRWTVDEERDLAVARSVFERLGPDRALDWEDVLKLFIDEPELRRQAEGIMRNEGYYRSILDEPPPAREHVRSLSCSDELKARADRVIPSASQTFSKGPSQYVQGVAPLFLERGAGSHVWDVDGNEYIDYPMALGPVILGHNHSAVTEAVVDQVGRGVTFSLPHALEVEVSELIVNTIPSAEMVRFAKNGSDATAGAVRAARAFTGRDRILCCGYHGWQDWYIGTTSRSLGVPESVANLTTPFRYNDLPGLDALLEKYEGQVAAIVMEPVGIEDPDPGFLEGVRERASTHGALLVFDEVITGFRIALGGAQEHYGVFPDLTCVGKAMANGFPLSAVAGRREVMRVFDEIFFSFTFGGEVMSLAAAKATINQMRTHDVIGHLWEQGGRLKDGLNFMASEAGLAASVSCVGLPPRTVVLFRDDDGKESLERKSLFQQECLKRGVLFSGGHNVCWAHSPSDIDTTLRVYASALKILHSAIDEDAVSDQLEGPPVQPVFRQP